MLKERIQKIVDYYDALKRENLDTLAKPLLKALLVDEETGEAEGVIKDILSMKAQNQNILSLKLGFNVPLPKDAEGDYPLGKVLKGDKTLHEFGIKDEELSRSILLVGRIGTGKTTTCMRILYEWAKTRKPAMIFDFKNDYSSLLPLLRGIHGSSLKDYFWMFMLGEDRFKFNPLRIPNQNGEFLVDPLAYMETFTDIFVHCFGLREPSASIMISCLKKLFSEYGVLEGSLKDFPTLNDLKEEVYAYEALSAFDRESKRSVYTRLRLLTEGFLGSVFDESQGFKFEDLLQKFVVFGMGNIPLMENRKFIVELFIGLLYNYAKKLDDRRKTKRLIVIEEAHNVLPKRKSSIDADILTKPEIALMELRDFGIGSVIIDQKPADLSPDCIAVTGTKIVHALDREEDKKAVGSAMGLNEEQKKYLSYLAKGEVFVKLDRESIPFPFHARIEPVTFTGKVSRNEIEEYMRAVFESYSNGEKELPESPAEIIPEKIIENQRWLSSIKSKLETLEEEQKEIIVLLGKGLACKPSGFRATLRLSGSEFKRHAIQLARKGLIGFTKPKAIGNPILYFLRPEGLISFKLLTGKWPYEARIRNLNEKYSHDEMKNTVIKSFTESGWRIKSNRVSEGYADVCLTKDGFSIPIEISTGSNKFGQIYKNILKCAKSFRTVYFVCGNRVAYNATLQQASKASFDFNGLSFKLHIILYEDFLKGRNFEKYEFS